MSISARHRSSARSRPAETSLSSQSAHAALLEALWPDLAAAIGQRAGSMIAFRRALHTHAERSGEEFETTARVRDALLTLGLSPQVGDDGLGVIVDIDLNAASSSGPTPLIALRCELDCVDVADEKQVDYVSKNAGACHACGHDAHTAMVLGAVAVLHEHRERIAATGIAHNIRAIFQPAEETGVGASSMIRQGALKNVAGIFAVHVEPYLDVGTVGLRRGAITAACQSFEIVITGRGGHTARPFEAIDPIPAATNLVGLLYQLGPRSMDSRYPLSLSVASINSGSSYNALPSAATIRGTLRAARSRDLETVKETMRDIADGVARATGTVAALRFGPYLPPTDNDHHLIDVLERSAHAAAGPGSTVFLDVPSLGGEDFAFYQQEIPGAMARLGAALPEREQRQPLHSTQFDIDERCLPVGAKLLAHAALHGVD